jgi:SPX domain protein involved in polyphosphate accumulation
MIRSLYLDTESDRFYEEGLNGVDYRKKFRIRMYNGSYDFIRLEKKITIGNLKKKCSAVVNKKFVENLIYGLIWDDYEEYKASSDVLQDVYYLGKTELLKPKAIIEYNRKAYVSDIGNVRITFDRNIMASERIRDFWEKDIIMTPDLPMGLNLLEVKYDGIFPAYISKLLNTYGLEQVSFSKYILAREAFHNNGRSELYEY